jgi:hypothetical protein
MNIHIMNFICHVEVVFVIIVFKLSIWKKIKIYDNIYLCF